jgi:hypothetical protein
MVVGVAVIRRRQTCDRRMGQRARRDDRRENRTREGSKWRCSDCGMLLGVLVGSRLHIQFARGHQYTVALTAICTCRKCGRLNELAASDGVRGQDNSVSQSAR